MAVHAALARRGPWYIRAPDGKRGGMVMGWHGWVGTFTGVVLITVAAVHRTTPVPPVPYNCSYPKRQV